MPKATNKNSLTIPIPRVIPTAIFLALLSVAAPTRPLAAQDNSECLVCHENPSFWESRSDGDRFVVTDEMLGESTHRDLACTNCHQGLTFPHPEAPEPAQCATCHRGQTRDHDASLHGQATARQDPLAPTCSTCHGSHEMLPSANERSRTSVMNIPALCGECHHEGTEVSLTRDIPQSQILENYSLSIHGAGLFRQGLTVTAVCTSCHTSHLILPHTDERSSIHADNVARTCMACHGRIEEVHLEVIEGRLWEEEPHVIPACVDCHQPHQIRQVFYDTGISNRECLQCHGQEDLVDDMGSQHRSLHVDEREFSLSAHAETGCAQCHTDVSPIFDARPCEAIDPAVDCAVCHAGESTEYAQSLHGTFAADGDADAPGCTDCHSKHATQLKSDPTSPTFPRNVPDLCARCHRQGESAATRIQAEVADIVGSYEMSIHGKGLIESGLTVTATCTSCHGPHSELPPEDPRSLVHRDNVSGTCGACHHGIEERFRASIHSEDVSDHDPGELPSCEDCHTSHTISRTDQANFRVLMMDQCGRCHEEEAETFFDTYHGKVSRLGEDKAAKCYDCHGTHDILPPSEAASMLSRRNIVSTCAQCHPGANRKFTGYLTHATHHDPGRYPWLFIAFWAMTGLLLGTLSIAMLHTSMWLFRLWRSPEDWKHAPVASGGPQKMYRRFTSFQRSLHLTMMISFIVLAGTGMALKFSYMGWAKIVATLTGGFAALGVLHRLGAIALIVVFIVHLVDVTKQKKAAGVTWMQFITAPDSLMFNRRDVVEFRDAVRWFLGRGPRPYYGRYTYWEKFDYFAVFWGMFIIGSTGLLLWFPELFTKVIPGSLVNVATIIHSDEALLAVAFIFTIHFFNTHFRLDKFPMDPVIFTGRVSIEELKVDKPREYDRMKAEGKLEERMVDAFPAKLETAFRVFGFTALGLGLMIIALIVYTMLFGYR